MEQGLPLNLQINARMNWFYLLLFPFLTGCFFAACQSTPSPNAEQVEETPKMTQTEGEKLLGEVLYEHDKVMPRMSEIVDLRRQINEQLKQAKGAPADTLRRHLDQLNPADKAMMDWMHQFKRPDNPSDTANLKYLKDQKQAMEDVAKFMNQSIEQAQRVVKPENRP